MTKGLLGVKFQPFKGILLISTVAVAPATPANNAPVTPKKPRPQSNLDVTEFSELSE